MKINSLIKKYSQASNEDDDSFETPDDLDRQEAQIASSRMESIKKLQSTILLFSNKAEELKNKLSSTEYFRDFSKNKISGKKFENTFIGKDADFSKWISVMRSIGSAKSPGKPDGLFGRKTILGVNAVDVISGLFVDYFGRAGIPFSFDNSDRKVFADCWQNNSSDDFAKKSAQYKSELADQVSTTIDKLNQAIDEVLKSNVLEKFIKDDDRDSFKINHSGKTQSYLEVEKNIEKYKNYGWKVNVRAWTGSDAPVNIYLSDVKNRSVFEDWKSRNSIKTKTDEQDALLISTIEGQFRK
jgi:hypothetical protein